MSVSWRACGRGKRRLTFALGKGKAAALVCAPQSCVAAGTWWQVVLPANYMYPLSLHVSRSLISPSHEKKKAAGV